MKIVKFEANQAAFAVAYPSDDYQYRQYLRTGYLYEYDFLGYINYVAGHLKCQTFYDVGSCFGGHSAFISAMSDLHVYCFEPNRASLSYLEKTAALSNIPRSNIFNVAIGSQRTYAELRHCKENFGQSFVSQSATGDIVMHSLDSFISTSHIRVPDMIKIDVEGFEMEVLDGAETVLKHCKPEIFVEILNPDTSGIFSLLGGHGYVQAARFGKNYHFTRANVADRCIFSIATAHLKVKRALRKWNNRTD